MLIPYIPDSPQSIYDEPPFEVAPSVWAGAYSCLNNHFLHSRNIKIIVNCSPTFQFIRELEASELQVSLDMLILLFDPLFLTDNLTAEEQSLLSKSVAKYNRVLQNYIAHFYVLSSTPVIHKLANGHDLAIPSPILSGNLKNLLFAINRLIKLLRNINNSVEILILSREDNGNGLQTAVSLLYLMDSYGLTFETSFNHLQMRNPKIAQLNSSYYEDLLIIENLRKFYIENNEIKSSNVVLTTNHQLKRRNSMGDEDEWMENRGKRSRE